MKTILPHFDHSGEEATCATIRSKLIKIGAVGVRKLTIVRLHVMR